MLPAYHIPIGDDELQLIGEICAIQGQIEWMIQNAVLDLFKVDRDLARKITGSTSINTNADIWIRAIRRRERRKTVLAHAEQAFRDLQKLTEGRNDFVHAIYFSRRVEDETGLLIWIARPGSEPPDDEPREGVALRVRSGKENPSANLKEVRNIAAEISVRMAHVNWISTRPHNYGPSPWHERLSELPVPESLSPGVRQAKEPRARPRPS